MVFCCALFSLLGVYIAVQQGDTSHGGRGGAVGVAFSFLALFLSVRNRYNSIDLVDSTSEELFQILELESNAEQRIAVNSQRIEALKRDLKRSQANAFKENCYLATAGVLSTMFWGFGDLLAEALIG